MVDRVSASIVIGGVISAKGYAELARMIESELLSTDWDGEPFAEQHRTIGEPLRLYAHQVAWGRFARLEAWCVATKLPFVRSSDAYPGEWGAERVVFVGEGEPQSYAADENGDLVVCKGMVEKLGSIEAILAHFKAGDYEVPPLVVEGEMMSAAG